MKYQKLLLTLIGGWILFIGIDSTHGHMGSLGIRSLKRPIQFAYATTRIVRTIILLVIAASTLLLVAKQDKRKSDEK
jgi:hypothetical protein